MYEKIAWSNFLKTGDIESFMEYRKLMRLNDNDNQMYHEEEINNQNVGDYFSELNKSQGDSNKRNLI